MGFAGACQPLRGTGDDAFLPHILFKEPVPEERETEKGLRPRDNVVACAGKGTPMTLPVKILSVLAGLSLAGSARARIWTNDRGATVVAVLVAVRDAEVDLKLQDGRVVAVPKNIFSGADQEYILEWVKSGGTLPDTDVGAENPPVQGDSGRRYVPLEPNWDAPWPERVVVPGFLLVKTVQETEDLSVYETDYFIMESPGKLPEAERMILARRFETILSALAAVPLNLAVARRPSRKYLVRVCFQEEDFNRAPGLRNGHLKFSPTSFTALLLRNKKGKLLKPELDPRFAVTHWAAQSMDWEHWLVDGFSAYMAFLPMEKEAPVFRKIPERLAAMVPRAVRTGRETLPALADMLSRDSAHSAAEHGVSSRGGTLQYWADLLWMVYWSHLEGNGKAERLRSYLRVRDAEGGGKARAVLLDGKTPEDVQGEMAAAWKKMGLRLRFSQPASAAADGKSAEK